LLVALFLSAVALRPQLVGVGPLLPEIKVDLGLAHAVAGLLATIPVLCMGLFAPPAPFLSERLGTRRAIALCLAAIGVFGLARALAPPALAVILLTFGVGVGIGLAGALLPVAVKERFPDRPAFATGVYTTGINLGSALASAAAVPIAHAAGGWRASFVVFSAVTLVLVVLWQAQTAREPAHVRLLLRPPRLPWRNGVAWVLVVAFGLMGVIFYGLNSWLPDSYVERGWSAGSAGALLAVFNVAALPGGLLVSWAADRVGSRRAYLLASATLMLGGVLGVVLLPGGGWLWAALMGFANGALFALVMTLPLDVADRPADVGAVAGLMLGAGYCIAAVAPFGLGAVRDATGSFTATLWVVAGAAAILLAVSALLSRERLHRREGGFPRSQPGEERRMSEDPEEQEKAEASRTEAGEKSMRPDIQAGALELAEGDEPTRHDHPSYRATAQERPAAEDES
jgi:CP family cyanate transporter-like MFS transporter